MQPELTRDDVVELIELSQQGHRCVCSADYLRNLADKITTSINLIQDLKSETSNQTVDRPSKQTNDTKYEPLWVGQLMYKHRGFSLPRFEDLGFLGDGNQAEANQIAKSMGQSLIEQLFDEKDIEHWEVKVRPSKQK